MIRFGKRIPIAIHPLFWITSALIGFLAGGGFLAIIAWIFVILVSVLVHEMGHALTACLFGLKPRVELVALGGLTYHQGEKLSFWKQFLIVLNGPVFGFCLFLLSWFLLAIPAVRASSASPILMNFFYINLIWTLLNLVPVLPLDGGQLLRIVLESFFGAKGFRYALIVGITISVSISLFFFLFQNFLAGSLFFLFAFQSFDMYRKMRRMTDVDRKDELKDALHGAEEKLKGGDFEGALGGFERVREEAKQGVLYLLATQYLAFLKFDQGKGKEAYAMLVPHKTEISTEALCLLHKTAFDEKDFSLVEEIGATCFQVMPTKEVALRNACASGALAKEKSAIGWLETAREEGLSGIGEILKRGEFDPIREGKAFSEFATHHFD